MVKTDETIANLGSELAELRSSNKQYAIKNEKLSSDITDLKTRFLDFDVPIMRIGKSKYTLAAIISDARNAMSVMKKIQVAKAPWRSGKLIDDFIADQILVGIAQRENLTSDAAMKESLVKKYSLTFQESQYLDRYLAIDALFRHKFGVPPITEKAAREYYERHKDQYANKKRIRALSVKYGKADEIEKSLLSVELLQEARAGRAFDAIAKEASPAAMMKELPLSGLSDWVRLKVAGLKEGEISNIISADNEFMIIQLIPSKPAYLPFESVRQDIDKRLSEELSAQKQSFPEWFSSLQKDVEFIEIADRW